MESLPSSPGSSETSTGDKAGRNYWERRWEQTPLPGAIDPHRQGLKNYPIRQFHKLFERVFKGYPTKQQKVIEIGCAQSVFLPYFARYFGFDVTGLDRSEIGCERARSILDREGVNGKVFCADLFSPPEHLLGRFDVVVSFGVVEHWENTSEALRAMSRFLNPQGRMITMIPNLNGLPGAIQRMMDRAVYDVHVPLDKEGFAAIHRAAGLEVEFCDYFMPIALEVLNVNSWSGAFPRWVVMRTYGAISRMVWLVDEHVVTLREHRWGSPYIFCAARKP